MRIGLKPSNFLQDRRAFTKDYDYSDVPTLFESDNVDCGDLIRFGKSVYSISMVSPYNNFALASAVNIKENPEEESSDYRIKCPVCGCEDNDSWECEDEDENYECGRCGAILSYTSETSRTFYVNVKKMPEIKNAVLGVAGNQHITTHTPAHSSENK